MLEKALTARRLNLGAILSWFESLCLIKSEVILALAE